MGRSKAESGYIEGESVAIAVRSAEAQYERLPALAADLVPVGTSRQFAVTQRVGRFRGQSRRK
jgi:hypothetical protein